MTDNGRYLFFPNRTFQVFGFHPGCFSPLRKDECDSWTLVCADKKCKDIRLSFCLHGADLKKLSDWVTYLILIVHELTV